MLSLRRCQPSLTRTAFSLPRRPQSIPSSAAAVHKLFASSSSSRTLLPLIRSRWLSTTPQTHASTATAQVEADSGAAPAKPVSRFEELDGVVDPVLIRTLTKRLGFHSMTEVQSLTIHEALKGVDVLAQAKTGTGKTIGFLLPVIQRILSHDPSLLGTQRRPSRGDKIDDIRAIIISPTRELAEQIAEESRKLVADTGIVVQTAVGGTQKRFHMQQMRMKGCHLLVGTPGRLKDILSDEYSGVSTPELEAFVLDEADRLLDQGFWPEIQEIQSLFPDRRVKDRQTMMFSATVPREVVKLVRSTMKPDLHFVRTVGEDEQATHEKVPQHAVIVNGLENMLPTLLELCQRETKARQGPSGDKPFKAIVYFNSTAEVGVAYAIFRALRPSHFPSTRIYHISSRLTQESRTRTTEQFRNEHSAILMSSDVTARGMDFPNVSHVIQCGAPNNADAYVHRIGRTARAGKEGEGWLLFPAAAAQDTRAVLRDLPLARNSTLQSASVDFDPASPAAVPPQAAACFAAVQKASQAVPHEDKVAAYLSLFGIFQGMHPRARLVDMMNRFCTRLYGWERPPALAPGLVQRLGIAGIPGVEVARGSPRSGGGRAPFGGDRGGFGGRGGGGGFGRSGFDDERGFGGDRSGGRSPFRSGGGYGSRSGGGGFGGRSGGYGDRDSRSGGYGDREGRSGGYGDRESRSGGYGGGRSSRF